MVEMAVATIVWSNAVMDIAIWKNVLDQRWVCSMSASIQAAIRQRPAYLHSNLLEQLSSCHSPNRLRFLSYTTCIPLHELMDFILNLQESIAVESLGYFQVSF
jgi:hypothetical protein